MITSKDIAMVLYPGRENWPRLQERSLSPAMKVEEVVSEIVADVRLNGDVALARWTSKLDKWDAAILKVSSREWLDAEAQVPASLKDAIQQAGENIRRFHASQTSAECKVNMEMGVEAGIIQRPIEKVGLYVPGGSAPLFSTVLMLGIPAMLAGCKEVIMCTPANKEGKIDPALLVAAQICKIKQVYKLGGAQAIAAMAMGTETIPKVDKIFGPGNSFVTEAKKQMAAQGVAMDMPAGPTELLIVADESAEASFVAADMLAQMEHSPDAQAICLSDNVDLLFRIRSEMLRLVAILPRKDIITKAFQNSRLIALHSVKVCLDFANEYAPEHLLLAIKDAENYLPLVQHAGAVFLGQWSAESAGDYWVGPNHTLPTSAAAKAFSALTLQAFMKSITWQKVEKGALGKMAKPIIRMALAEGLKGHALAMQIRWNAVQAKAPELLKEDRLSGQPEMYSLEKK